jgi:hypothetical protein
MKVEFKQIVQMVGLAIFYILISTLGVYNQAVIFYFAFLALPFTMWCVLQSKFDKYDIYLNLIVALGIYFVTGQVFSIGFYVIGCVIPSYIVGYGYKKSIPLSKLAIYAGIGVIGGFYFYVILARQWGMDYFEVYLEMVALYKDILKDMVAQLSIENSGFSSEQITEAYNMLLAQVDLIIRIYPALLLVVGLIMGSLQVIFVNLGGRLARLKVPSLKTLFNFKLSKLALFLYGAALLIILSQNTTVLLQDFGLNLTFFMQTLFQWVGFIALIALIIRKGMSPGIKVFLVGITIIVVIASPTGLSILGLLDTAFNYRNSEVVI